MTMNVCDIQGLGNLIRSDRLIAAAITVLLALVLATQPAAADKRVALVIGNSAYLHANGPQGAAGDARVVASALQNAGFTLSGGAALLNLDRNGLDQAIQDFGRQITDADVALVYYAGHAIQLHGSDFLVPVDANPTKEADVDNQMLHVGLLTHQMEGSAKRLNLIVLDACHKSPFEGRGLNGLEQGLAALHLPDAMLVAYAAQPDTVVPDTSDMNNLFAMTLAESIQKPGLPLLDMFNEVGLAVKRQTNGAQQPFVAFSPINTRFAFVGAPPAAAVVAHGRSPAIVFPPIAKDLRAGLRERVVLYDEDPNDPKGRQFVGTVVWRTEQIKASGDQKAGLGLRADIEIPDRNLKLTLLLRQNTDPALPASHTAELTFVLSPDFAGGGISNVPGILMKTNEQARGTPLAGLAVKITESAFLVGFSNVAADRARNIELLKERAWFDIPLVYKNQRRAILAIAKGTSGEQAFAGAMSSWDEHP